MTRPRLVISLRDWCVEHVFECGGVIFACAHTYERGNYLLQEQMGL